MGGDVSRRSLSSEVLPPLLSGWWGHINGNLKNKGGGGDLIKVVSFFRGSTPSSVDT